MSLQLAANHLAAQGRGPDTTLVHMSPREVAGLQALARAHGGSLTINPQTGLPEAGFLDKLLPTIIGAAVTAFTGIPAWQVALGVGGIEAARTGDLGKGIMAGFGAYTGANLGGALAGAGEAATMQEALAKGAIGPTEGAIGQALSKIPMEEAIAGASRDAVTNQLQRQALEETAQKIVGMSPLDKMSAGIQSLGTEAGRSALVSQLGGPTQAAITAAGVAAPLFAGESARAKMPQTTTPTAYVTPYAFDPNTQALRSLGRYEASKFPGFAAEGGLQRLADGGVAFGSGSTPSYQRTSMSPGMLDFADRSEPVVRMARGGIARFAFGGTTQDIVDAYNREVVGGGMSEADFVSRAMSPEFGASAEQLGAARDVLLSGGAATNTAPAVAASAVDPYAGLTPLTASSSVQNIADLYNQTVGKGTATEGQFVDYARAQGVGIPSLMEARDVLTPGTARTATSAGDYLTAGATPQDLANLYRTTVGAGTITEADLVKYAQAKGIGTPALVRAAELVGSPDRYLTTRPDLMAESALINQVKGAYANMVTNNPKTGLTTPQFIDLAREHRISDDILRKAGLLPPLPITTITGGTGKDTITGGAVTDAGLTAGGVRDAYVEGGGRIAMPSVNALAPGERPMVQNAVVSAVNDYIAANPGATMAQITSWALANNMPAAQVRAAVNEYRFNQLTGGSKSAYDYLMGRGAYPTSPYLKSGTTVARPYAEAMGLKSTLPTFNLPKVAAASTTTPTTTAAPIGSYRGLTAADKTALQSVFANARSSGDYSALNSMLNRYQLTEADLREAFPGITNADIAAYKDKVEFYQPPAEQVVVKGGGLLGLAAGGVSDLGDYSDGGRLLRGPGDGVSDSIPATIGGRRPARLADGEFVVPARIVSELGNGSTEAGAKKLYAMMDRIQAGRKKSVGKGKVAVNSRADKHLPA